MQKAKAWLASTIELQDLATGVARYLPLPVGLAAESGPMQTPFQIISSLYREAIKDLMTAE